jgi:hypothetical protein
VGLSTSILKTEQNFTLHPLILCSNLIGYKFGKKSILAFFNNISRNESGQKFFSNLALLSHASPIGVTYEGVAVMHMARLMGPAHAQPPMWCHVGASHARSCVARLSHAVCCGVIGDPASLHRVSTSHARVGGATQSRQPI